MRTLSDATLYTVNGPRGTYWAIRCQETGAVWTERTESAAAALADEHDLIVVNREDISHAMLLEMMAERARQESAAGGGLPVGGDTPAPGLAGSVKRLVRS